MNEFFLASNRSVFNEDIEIKQITVRDLDQWSQFAEMIRKDLKQDYSNENLESIVKQHIVAAIMGVWGRLWAISGKPLNIQHYNPLLMPCIKMKPHSLMQCVDI